MRTHKSLDCSAIRVKHSAYCKAKPNTALSEALQAKHDNFHNLLGAVHYIRIDRASQIDEHLHRKRNVTDQLKKNWSEKVAIFTQYEKCDFFIDTIDYLGHVFRPRCLQLMSHIMDTIHGLKLSISLTKLRPLLGLCNVFIRFVPNFARITFLLNQSLKKFQLNTFTPLNSKALQVIHTLENALISPSVLAL